MDKVEKMLVTDTQKRLFFEEYFGDYKGMMAGNHDAYVQHWAKFLMDDVDSFIEDLDDDAVKFAPIAKAITNEDCAAWLVFEE